MKKPANTNITYVFSARLIEPHHGTILRGAEVHADGQESRLRLLRDCFSTPHPDFHFNTRPKPVDDRH